MRKKKIISVSIANALLDYFKTTSKNLFDLSIDIVADPEKLIGQAGFTVKYPSITSMLFGRRIYDIKRSPNFKYENNKIYLTQRGRIKIIKSIIKEKNNDEKWDGKWRAVIFDIPELKRHERRFLRLELKQMKFKELQKSIWVCPYNIENELFAILKLWKIDFQGDIRFLKIDKVTEDKDIKKYFKLSR